MTEEMIDGVDVSGCIYKKDGIADCGMFADGEFRCEGQICLYKQVLRLETENKKLKEAIEKINSIIDNDFINRYMELSFNEYDAILEQIEKICEVLKDE